jgi:protein-disulfide isomerase
MMTRFKLWCAALAVVAGLFAAGAYAQGNTRNWLGTVAATDGGHRIGNPNAPVKLTEYISYTCPHCAEFVRTGETPLELAYVGPGKVSVEVRHLLRDPIDAVAAQLVSCAPPAKFLAIHKELFLKQGTWAQPMVSPSRAQEQRWRASGAAGRRAIASDFHLYDLMERHGMTRAQSDHCLANQAQAQKMADTAAREWKLPGIEGTPAFAINGAVLANTFGWDSLQPQIAAKF